MATRVEHLVVIRWWWLRAGQPPADHRRDQQDEDQHERGHADGEEQPPQRGDAVGGCTTSIGSPLPASSRVHTEWIEQHPTARIGAMVTRRLGALVLAVVGATLVPARRGSTPTPSCWRPRRPTARWSPRRRPRRCCGSASRCRSPADRRRCSTTPGRRCRRARERHRRQRRHRPRRRPRRRHLHDLLERHLDRLAPHQRGVGVPRRRAVGQRPGGGWAEAARRDGRSVSSPPCSRPWPTPARSSASVDGGSRWLSSAGPPAPRGR